MKRLLFLYLLCSVGLLYPQKKQPKAFSFNVEGEIRRFQGRTIYLHHKWDDKELTDSAQVTDGRFNFKLRSAEPNMYWFTLAPGIAAQPNLIFFVDKGKVTVRLIGDSLSASSVKAGKTQDDYVAYLAIGRQLAARQQSLQAEYTLAMQKSDRDRVKQVQAEYQASSDDYFAVDLKNFVKTHPKSAVSGYIIYREFNNPNVPLALAEECLGYLDKSIENTKFVRLASKRVADLNLPVIRRAPLHLVHHTCPARVQSQRDNAGKTELLPIKCVDLADPLEFIGAERGEAKPALLAA